jgi:DNA-binding SARP family transcriptional activator
MDILHISLFGRFHVQCGEPDLADLCTHKAQELLCYLILYRDRPHTREGLADVLCGEASTSQSRKCLRQALWQLQTSLDCQVGTVNGRLLHVEPKWIRLNLDSPLLVDVVTFEEAFVRVQGVPGRELDGQQVQSLQSAVQLYKGDLLEGWYQDWCVYERERLQNVYLMLLEKLIDYCEAQHKYEPGIAYGMRVLREDRARERTHRQLMRLYSMAGDRTAALRQYESCAAALQDELDLKPTKRTAMLYEQIRRDQGVAPSPALARPVSIPEGADRSLPEVLDHLTQLQAVLENALHQVQHLSQTVELVLNQKH